MPYFFPKDLNKANPSVSSAMKPKPGDLVEIKTKEEVIKGILMPQEGKTLVVKLDSGYNIGIDSNNIKKIKMVKKQEKKKEKPEKTKQKKGLPLIVILHTGGTIASKVDYDTGAVISRFSPQELLDMFPELRKIANIDSRLVRNMWSDDMRFAHYNLMANEIQKEIKKGVDGVIITHGTDTLHYTSAALAFILEDLPIPVLLVGAQRSSDRGSSDAAQNFINAAYFIAKSDFAGVAICMHENLNDDSALILPATKTRKMHTSRRDTFKAINVKPWARVNYNEKKIQFLKKGYQTRDKKRALKLKSIKENLKVGILKVHTNMYASEFLAYKGFDGLILEGTGLGHAPISTIDEFTKEHTKIRNAIKLLCKKTIVAMAPQTIFGRLDMNVYAPGREIQGLGVLGNYSDMTPETAFIKLAWLLSNHKKPEVKQLITKNLRGEISERTEQDTFLP